VCGCYQTGAGITQSSRTTHRGFDCALLSPFTDNVDLTDGDRSTYAAKAEAERAKVFEKVDVTFGVPPHRIATESDDLPTPEAHRAEPENPSNELGG
jgi:hypothetical protein